MRLGAAEQAADVDDPGVDALDELVGDEAIGAHFAREAPDQALDELIDLTLEKGAPDNVTGIAIWISEPTLLSFAETKP